MIDIVWFWLILCETFYTYYYALTLFHDNSLLFAAKVYSHSHFLFYSLSWLAFDLWLFWYPLISSLIATLASPYLVDTLL